jgi:GLPGLI family protein
MRIRKKYTFYIFIYALLVCGQKSQISAQFRDISKKIVIDDCKYTITYKYKFIRDTINKEPKYDKQILEIGNKTSHYYSIYGDKLDSIYYNFSNNKKQHKHGKSGSDGINPRAEARLKPNERAQYDNYYINYPQAGILTIITSMVYKEFIYEEYVPKFEWKIFVDTATILEYKCLKATTTFRGRDYEVWFTPFIPIRQGPWKFNGLPGLILKAIDTKRYFEWTAVGIEKPDNKKIYAYNFDKNEIQTTTRKDMINLLHKRWKDPVGLRFYLRPSSQSFSYKDNTGKVITIERNNMPNYQGTYIPIPELE